MECSVSKSEISAYLDRAMSDQERNEIRKHLRACRHCSLEAERQQQVRNRLLTLPRRTVPTDLTYRLRVAASRARLETIGLGGRWQWRERLGLSLRHLMRPLALPAVGGLCSAVFLFSALMPTFQPAFAMANSDSPTDVPIVIMTEPTVKYMAPIAFGEGDAEVDLNLDGHGHIMNYKIVSVSGPKSDQLRRAIENNLLFIELWPATSFGKPIAGTVRISFRSAAGIDVRG